MRTATITIGKKDYIGCFSTRVLNNLEEYTGMSFENALSDILEKRSITDIAWLVVQVINAGDRYAKMEGIENPGEITTEEFYDRVGVDDYPKLFTQLNEIINGGTTPQIETKTPKNAKATPEK